LGLAGAGAGYQVDVGNREEVRNFYNTVHAASGGVESGWTGAYDGCVAGTTDAGFKDAVIRRVNYYRAMAGVPAGVTWDAAYSVKAQEAALMMSAQGSLSHYPPASWACYTEAGADGAENSNLALGSSGPASVDGYMEDYGAGNTAVGHRRWLLYPQTRVMGTGDVPGGDGRWEANAIWVFDGRFGTERPGTREAYVAWPPPGYVPYMQVFPRWSFAHAGADFSGASVTLTSNGVPVAVRMEAVAGSIGEPTLVWHPSALDTTRPMTAARPVADIEYAVEIRGVRIGGEVRQFNYHVRAFDPQVPGVDAVVPVVAGAAQVPVGVASGFSFNPVPKADGHEWRSAVLEPGTVVEGAEAQLAGFRDGTSGTYPVTVTSPVAAGSRAFRLAHPNPPEDQALEYERGFLAGAAAELRFRSRLGYASGRQRASVQVSLDEGRSWVEVYGQDGTDGAGETSYQSRAVSLAGYAGRTLHVRFVYRYAGSGSYYPQTDPGIGWYFDEVTFAGMERLGVVGVPRAAAGGGFSFEPTEAGDYLLQVRALVFGGYALDWGPALAVSASGTAPTSLSWTGLPELAGGTVRLGFRVSGSPVPGRFELMRRVEPGWDWEPVPGAVLEEVTPGREFRFSVGTGGESRGFYRVRGF
jgi:uncharacterized protein YkwD